MRSVENVRSILQKGTDRLPLPAVVVEPPSVHAQLVHENLRGPGYYDN
jgi:hypothetical protein